MAIKTLAGSAGDGGRQEVKNTRLLYVWTTLKTMSEVDLAPFAAWSVITGVLILVSSVAYRAYSKRGAAA